MGRAFGGHGGAGCGGMGLQDRGRGVECWIHGRGRGLGRAFWLGGRVMGFLLRVLGLDGLDGLGSVWVGYE